MSPHLGNANLAGVKQQQQPTPPNPTRTPNHPQPSPRLVPNRSPSMPAVPTNLTNETLQQYIADMQAAAARSGQPPPTAADIQAAALAAYARANGSRAPGSTGPPSAGLPGGPNGQQQQPQQQQQTPRQMTQQQLNGLPQIPPDMKAKIEVHLETIRKKVERGELTQEQAGQQVKRLQEMANQCVLSLSILLSRSRCERAC